MYEEYWYLAYGFITLISGLAISFIVMPFVMKWMKNKRIVGIDAHKKDEPVIPEMGGVSLLIGLTVSMLIASAILPEMMRQFLSFLTVTLIAGAVGALDDLKTLSAKMKPFLTIFAGLPILVMNTYDPYLPLPLIGSVRFTIIYPIMIPIAIAVTSNAVNMMDPFNGVM
ncbi:MAG: hypothetical protein H3Z51_01430, partial [archaeon]|nr:hypothetical protein [archaeon]